MNIKKNFTIYSGLGIRELIYLAKLTAPVDKNKKKIVFEELFHRYFNIAKDFNLYDILSGEHYYFSFAMRLELIHDKVNIPVQHAEAFIKRVLEFIDYIDKRVLNSKNLRFEWQLHELAGLRDMLEKVREAKISDQNLRQKINLFIDKINEARKKTLLLIEEAKKKESEVTKTVEEKAALATVSQEYKALMEQKLQHLQISLSKTKKEEFEDILSNLRLYYPEDQKKILLYGLKKWAYQTYNRYPARSFYLNITAKIPVGNMLWILDTLNSSSDGINSLIQLVKPGGTFEDLIEFIKDFYMSCKGSTERGCIDFINQFINETKNSALYYENLISLMKDNMYIIENYSNKPLSELLKNTIEIELPVDEHYRELRCKITVVNGEWVVHEPGRTKHTVSVLEQFYYVYSKINSFRGGLFHYSGDYLKGDHKIEISESFKPLEKYFGQYIAFPLTITFDKETLQYLKEGIFWGRYSNTGNLCARTDSKMYKALTSLLSHKFAQNAVSRKEIELLYKDKDFNFLFEVLIAGANFSGTYRSRKSYFDQYFSEAVDMFDFSNECELKQFFNLKFRAEDFFDNYCRLSETSQNKIVKKLKNECPHEYYIIADYFESIEVSTITTVETLEQFQGLSPLQLLMLENEGIKTSTQTTFTGCIEKHSSGDIKYTKDNYKIKCIIDYFKTKYQEE